MIFRATAAVVAFAAFAIGSDRALAQPVEPAADQPAAEQRQPPAAESSALDGASQDVVTLTNWIISSHDNGELPFMVIDKVGAQLFVFDRVGQSLGQAPVLVGITKGDESTPGVGDRELSNIPVKDRTTPAGRFVSKYGPAHGHQKVLWVDYADAISLHAVVTANRKERRLQRLNSPTPDDNRITFGCINAPTAFYNQVVRPLFTPKGGVVYVLPETRTLAEVFPAIAAPVRTADASDTSP